MFEDYRTVVDLIKVPPQQLQIGMVVLRVHALASDGSAMSAIYKVMKAEGTNVVVYDPMPHSNLWSINYCRDRFPLEVGWYLLPECFWSGIVFDEKRLLAIDFDGNQEFPRLLSE